MNKPESNSFFLQPLLTPFQQFVRGESFSGVLLIISAVAAFIIANTALSDRYFALLEIPFGVSFAGFSLQKPLILWINDGLMAVFFLMVGLEIKRELLVGELSNLKDASLSVFAALGGMVVPALIYTMFNWNSEGMPGWGIPMATDIAFALGVLSLLGSRVPLALKVFLTALAIVDDLGAVLVIALFYTAKLKVNMLFLSFAVLVLAWFYGRVGGRRLVVYLLLGLVAWFFMLKSGVHATVAGVLLAFTVPMVRKMHPETAETKLREITETGSFEEVESKIHALEKTLFDLHSPLHKLEHALHPLVAYLIMPVFAFFNAGVALAGGGGFFGPVTLGCALGLVLGKPIGVFLFAWGSSQMGLSALPKGVSWNQIFAVGLLAGIGFTMSFFIANLAFGQSALLDQAKIGIFSASILAAVVGLVILNAVSKKET